MRILSTNYLFIEELPFSNLEQYQNHRRLGVFYHKGTKCAMEGCDKVGTRLIVGEDNGGGIHVDVYTDDMELMTVDHSTPVSFGGSDDLSNKFPMCSQCNFTKANRFEGLKWPEGFSIESHTRMVKASDEYRSKVDRKKGIVPVVNGVSESERRFVSSQWKPKHALWK